MVPMCEALYRVLKLCTKEHTPLESCPFVPHGRIASFRQSITMLGRKQSIVGEHSMVTNDMLEEVTLLASMNLPGGHRGR